MRTRYQNLRSSTALARPAAGSGLPGQFWVNMADQVIGWFDDAGAPVDLPFVKPPALAAYLPLAGGTMTGALILAGAPTQALNPATKAYADAIDTAIRAAFAAADNAVRVDFAAADTAIRNEFRAADVTLGNDINALSLATSNALATKLALAGGTMTGPLVLAAAPTQPLQAATKKYVDDQIAAIPAPVIPPGTIISDTPPADPKVGQLWFKTVEPVGLYIWYQDADSAQWVQVSGGGSGGQSQAIDIVQGVAGVSGWQVVGDQLICWFTDTTPAGVAQRVTFARPFKNLPCVTVSPISSVGSQRTAHIFFLSPTVVDVVTTIETGAQAAMGFYGIAIGEARDEDKMPKTVGGAGGAGSADFATPAEARAGVRPDAVMSPATVRALSGLISSPVGIPLAGHTLVGIPDEATEIEMLLDYIGSGAAAAYNIDITMNGIVAAYVTFRTALANGVAVAAGDLITTALRCEAFANSQSLVGHVKLLRGPVQWIVDGKWRSGPNHVSVVGSLPAAVKNINTIKFTPSVAMTIGQVHARWRI
jgi:hypothetical protein